MARLWMFGAALAALLSARWGEGTVPRRGLYQSNQREEGRSRLTTVRLQ